MIEISPDLRFIDVFSDEKAQALNITGCEYADLISFESIINSTSINNKIGLIRNSQYIDIANRLCGSNDVGLLYMYLDNANKVLLIIDDARAYELV